MPQKAAPAPLTNAAVTPSPERKSVLSDGPAEPVAVPTPNADVNSGFHVEVAAVERTWLSITADDKEVYSGVLDVAETKELEGHNSARIRTGNAGGVNVLFK